MKTEHLQRHAAIAKRLAALKADLGAGDTAPPGWVTTAQLATFLGITQRAAWGQIKDWMSKGLCEVKSFKTQTQQHFRYVPHYRFAPKVEAAYGIFYGKGKR